jgi:sortase A
MAEHAGRRRRWSTWLGAGFMLAGLGLLAYVAWQYWGTNWVSHRKQEKIVEDVREQWDEQWDKADKQVGDAPDLTAKGTPVVHTPDGDVAALVRIPAFGDDYVIPVLEGTGDAALAAGFGHFDDSVDPGQVGNYAMAGHRVTHGEPLNDMPALDIGDEVIVETRTATYTYELTSGGDDLRVSFRDGWVVAPLPTNPDAGGVQPRQIAGQRLLTLTTCAELFHTDDRLVAFGILVDRQVHE